MNKYLIYFTFLVSNLIWCNYFFGQNNANRKNISQNTFYKSRIDVYKYHLWWHRNRWFPSNDTLPYFVDDAKYKGVLNYGVSFVSTDERKFNFIENFKMFKLNVEVKKCIYNSKDSIVDIEGLVTGGWTYNDRKDKINGIDIFIGEKNDTISNLYFSANFNAQSVLVSYKGTTINNTNQVLDTFPSFSLKKYTYFKTDNGNERKFKIKSKINKNSLIVFGLAYCYSEIFDIGKLIFTKELKNSKVKKNNSLKPTIIIQNNERNFDKINNLDDIEFSKSKDFDYYKITKKAEDYIIVGNFKKAKKEYDKLLAEQSYVFARDIHNSLRSCVLIKDYQTALKWCKKIALKGVKLSYFDAKLFDDFKKNQYWNDFLESYPFLNKKYKEGLNTELLDQINELVIEDQSDYGLESRKEESVLLATTNRVTSKLINTIKEKGFPSEEKIGIQMENDTIIKQNPVYSILIRHAYQQNSSKLNELKRLLNKSAYSLDYDSNRSDLNLFVENCCLQVYKGNLYNLRSCDLDENQVKRVTFKFNNPYKFIIVANYITIAVENPNEDESFIEDRLVFLKKLTDDWYFYEKPNRN